MQTFDKDDIWLVAEGLHNQSLSLEQRESVKQQCAKDPVYEQELNEALSILNQITDYGKTQHFRSLLSDIKKGSKTNETRHIELPKWWKTAAIAAGVAILTSTFTVWTLRQQRTATDQYKTLRRELLQVKASQNALIKNINQQSMPVGDSRFAGTGFALTNDGYLVTNYHVIEDADSVYIQSSKGDYHKAVVIKSDVENDVVLLKITDSNFKFSEQPLPYAFINKKQNLGSKVFTLGYPKDEVVYNEGYISSANGYQGDTMQYQLVLPASPGQSGAPVLDSKGNVIGLVTGKLGSDMEEVTYAVSSKAISNLLSHEDIENKIHLSKGGKLQGLSREQQLEALQPYTFMIRVYK